MTTDKKVENINPLIVILLLLILIGSTLTTAFLISSSGQLLQEGSGNTAVIPTPSNVSTPEPSPTSSSTLSPTLTPVPVFKPKNFAVLDKYKPEAYGLKYEVANDSGKAFPQGDNSFGSSEEYSKLEGITGFRGNNYRTSASYGFVDVKEEKLQLSWTVPIGFIDTWTGVGWTGQPAIVRWSNDVKNSMNINSDKKAKNGLTEVIYATMDGKIYFLDLQDGKATRNPIDIGFPFKGSVAIDPRGYPILYAGQGIEMNGTKMGAIGHRIFNLVDQKQIYFIDGIDTFAYRKWGAFDSSPAINARNDSMVLPGENGLLYFIKLNTTFSASNKSLQIKPDIYKMKFKTNKSVVYGMENSIAIYKNYSFFADNDGMMYCMDLNKMVPVWIRSVTDDTDSTTLLEETEDELSLYTGCGVDGQGNNGNGIFRKINALTAETVWEKQYPCAFDKEVSGGVMSTGIIGKNDLKDLVIFNVAKTKDTPNSGGGKLIACDKKTGKEVWTQTLKTYAWSSPVDVYTKDGKGYLVQCTSDGNIHLIDGKTGKILNTLTTGYNIEGSPAVFDDTIVIGTRGQSILGVKIK